MLKTKLLPLPCNYLKDKVVLKEMQKGSKIKKQITNTKWCKNDRKTVDVGTKARRVGECLCLIICLWLEAVWIYKWNLNIILH